METLTRAESARINGAKSRGPKTAEGRAKSSLNAMRHGITARTLVLQNEDPELFLYMFNQYLDYFQPESPVEVDLVTDLVAARWRLRRIWRYQTALQDIELITQTNLTNEDEDIIGAQAFETAVNKSGFNTALRFETHLHRTYRRTLALLMQIAKQTQGNA